MNYAPRSRGRAPIFVLKPWHIPQFIGSLFMIGAAFAVAAISTTTEATYSIDPDEPLSSVETTSNIGSQLSIAIPLFLVALAFSGVAYLLRKRSVSWPWIVANSLYGLRLARDPGPDPHLPDYRAYPNPQAAAPPYPAGPPPQQSWAPHLPPQAHHPQNPATGSGFPPPTNGA